MLFSFLRKLLYPSRPRSNGKRRTSPTRARLQVVELEGRTLLSTFMVTNAGDSSVMGSGSLRRAILDSNSTPGPNMIQFAIPGAGVHTIMPDSALPAIMNNAVVIDGTSQMGFAGAPLIVLDGSLAGSGASGLTLSAAQSTVKGLAIDNFFSGFGINIESNQNAVMGNYLGTDASGSLARGNLAGLFIGSDSGNLITNNLISGNLTIGVELTQIGSTPLTSNAVIGNLIGTNSAGTQAVPNQDGVVILSGVFNSTIKSNVISGNGMDGVFLQNTGSGNVVQNNLIGLSATGTAALANAHHGVRVVSASPGLMLVDNFVSGNGMEGIELFGASGVLVRSNVVGTDTSGTKAVPNHGNAGIEIFNGATGNLIDGNLISGNSKDGISIHDSTTMSNAVLHNVIGLSEKAGALANGAVGVEVRAQSTFNLIANNFTWFNAGGIFLHDTGTTGNLVQDNNSSFNATFGVALTLGASSNLVGGNPGQGNAIAMNGSVGVIVDGATTLRDAILDNSIFGNGSLGGIALTNGGNHNLPKPVLVSAVHQGNGHTAVTGTLHAAANAFYRVEFFDNPSGGDEGQIFLGFTTFTTDANGNATFMADLASAATSLTATESNALPDTSPFSAPLAVSGM